MIAHTLQLARSLAVLSAVYVAAQVLGIISYHGGEALRLYELRGHVIIPDGLAHDLDNLPLITMETDSERTDE